VTWFGFEVLVADALGAVGEQQVHALAGLAVQDGGLGGPHRLPGGDGLSQERVNGLGECGAGLVNGDIEQADCRQVGDARREPKTNCMVVP
jgi:hypothetical protein